MIRTLPPALAEHVAHVKRGLRGGAAGPDKAVARESLDAIVSALVGARGRAEAAQAKIARMESK